MKFFYFMPVLILPDPLSRKQAQKLPEEEEEEDALKKNPQAKRVNHRDRRIGRLCQIVDKAEQATQNAVHAAHITQMALQAGSYYMWPEGAV